MPNEPAVTTSGGAAATPPVPAKSGLTTEFVMLFENDGRDVTFSVGVGGGMTTIKTSDAIRMGSPVEFAYWLNKNYSATIDLLMVYGSLKKYEEALAAAKNNPGGRIKPDDLKKLVQAKLKQNSIPASLIPILTALFTAEVIITEMYYQSKSDSGQPNNTSSSYRFGLAVRLPIKFALLPNVNLKQMTLRLEKQSTELVLPAQSAEERKQIAANAKLAAASATLRFSTKPADGVVLRVEDASLKFKTSPGTGTEIEAKIEDDIKATLEGAVTKMTTQTTGGFSKCRFELRQAMKEDGSEDATKYDLMIFAKTPGPDGNTISVSIDPSTGVELIGVVDGKLSGGAGVPAVAD